MYTDKKKFGFGGGRSGGSSSPRSGGSSKPSHRRTGGGQGAAHKFGQREMFKATCDQCKAACRLPFKPTGQKPVLCSNCFEDAGNGEKGYKGTSRFNRTQNPANRKEFKGGGGAGNVGREMMMLNEKMDKIMKALHI